MQLPNKLLTDEALFAARLNRMMANIQERVAKGGMEGFTTAERLFTLHLYYTLKDAKGFDQYDFKDLPKVVDINAKEIDQRAFLYYRCAMTAIQLKKLANEALTPMEVEIADFVQQTVKGGERMMKTWEDMYGNKAP
jgi:hypothetical protein